MVLFLLLGFKGYLSGQGPGMAAGDFGGGGVRLFSGAHIFPLTEHGRLYGAAEQ